VRHSLTIILSIFLLSSFSCENREPGPTIEERVFYNTDEFVMGVDLSYLNQILDMGGSYRDSGMIEDPYRIFSKYGSNVARFRLWHNPTWTREIYGDDGAQLYNDFDDVKRAIAESKKNGMEVLLDFHYSDNWADPQKQVPPTAWTNLTNSALKDSIYNYTYNTLRQLDALGLMPDYVQPGNEINPGFVLPQGNRWNGNAGNFVELINSGIKAVRDAGALSSATNPQIILHVAQPENALSWFDGLAALGLSDFDIAGISYYYIWSEVAINDLSDYISDIKTATGRRVMVMETCYPFTTANADSYGNIIDTRKLSVSDYPPTIDGQYNYLVKLCQEIIDGGGSGIFYWEPGWITSDMKTQWGQGSAWDCNALFNSDAEVIRGMDYMTYKYKFE